MAEFDDKLAAYHRHLDACQSCRDNPMLTTCRLGPELMRAAALAGTVAVNKEPVIARVRITAQPKALFDPMPVVWVRLVGELQERRLFDYYPDEIQFTEADFIGLTLDQAYELKRKRDADYLRSP